MAFNDGSSGVHVFCPIMESKLGALLARDRKQKRESEINASIVAKKIRQDRRKKKKSIEDSMIDKEGVLYETGAFKGRF